MNNDELIAYAISNAGFYEGEPGYYDHIGMGPDTLAIRNGVLILFSTPDGFNPTIEEFVTIQDIDNLVLQWEEYEKKLTSLPPTT